MFDGISNILKVAFDSTLEGVILVDDSAKIIMANRAIETCLGYAIEEIIGKDVNIFLPKSLHQIHNKHISSYFKDPNYLSFNNAREINGLHKNGSAVALELRLNQFEFEGKKYAKAYISDISIRKEKEKHTQIEKMKLEEKVKDNTKELQKVVKQLRQTNHDLEIEIQKKVIAKDKARKALIAEREVSQLKTKFLSLASHEFRTPLSGILTSTALIDKYIPKENANITKHINVIKTMVNHLSNILDDFMSLERIETGDIHYKFSSFGFNELMKEIVVETKTLLKSGQTINYTPCKICPEIFQDKKIIRIILSNVLYNAIKYSPENSPIDIKVSDKDFLKITISDKGIGIPEAEQINIFKRFFRASNASHFQGTGIGLNIVKANIEGLGGTIHFKSEENKGSTFTIRLPKNVS
jgi:PAS domain S-box-containing protein